MESPMKESGENDIPEFEEIFEPLKFYLKSICIPILFPGSTENELFEKAFESESTLESLNKFSRSTEYSTLMIEALPDRVAFNLEVKMHSTYHVLSSVAAIKSLDMPLHLGTPFSNQMHVIGMEIDREGDTDEVNQSFYRYLQQLTRHMYAPLARSAKHGTNNLDNEEDDHLVLLQKRIRELDFALEQCQRGTSIPSINLPTPPEFTEPAKQTTPIQIRNLLDKYNPSQVDQFFSEMNLLPILGDTDEMRERFSMEVNKLAKLWPIEIRKQTKLINSPFPGSVEKELDFWQEMDRKLNDTKLQLDGSPVLLTKLVLKRTNTVSAQLIVEVELELDRCLKIANVSLAFLRDFPIEELLVTNTLHPKLSRCITQCLNHFSKLKHSNYSFTRAIRLLEVLGAITLNKIIQILRENDIMRCSVDELRNIKTQCDEVFLAWKTYLSAQRVILKDVAKRRNEKTFTFKFEFDTMQRRINSIVEFREQHEKILEILSVVMVGEDGDFITELSDAYHLVLRTVTDCFDITQIGATTWNSSMQLYEKRLEKVEEHITRILEDRLGKAKSADEMFRIFSTFNPLFFRPTIRNAVNSFRTLLVKNVREDVRRLQDKFKMRYADSFERVTADLRDIPPLSGQIIWARQIENQLATLMRRIQDVLGTGWEDHLEGKQLKEVCDELRGYLDTSQIYEEWLQQQLKIDTNKFSKLKDFLLLVEEDNRSGLKELKVNFDDKLVIVFKEVKYLEWLLPNMSVVHKSIPNTIKTRSTEAYARYPIALALQSALTTFNQAKKNINNSNSMLLVAHVQAVRDIIKEAIGGSKRSKWVKWDTKDLNDWVHHLSVKVYALQERVDDVKEKTILAEQLLEKLKTCEYEREKLEEGISSLQKIADELPMKGLSNISQWVNRLDSRVEEIIRERVKKAVNIWVNSFNKEDQSLRDAQQASKKGGSDVSTLQKSLMSRLQNLKEQANKSEEKEVKVETIQLEQTVHEIVLSNQILFLTPTLEQARKYWMTDFHNYLAVVATLPRIVSTRFQVFAESQSDGGNYGDLLFALEPKLLKQPFLVIEDKIQQAGLYVQQWLQYQALWDASFQVIADRIGNDINKWQQLLDEIKEARKTIETVEEEKLYGPIVINHKQVQNKINAKYDAWQKESQIRFGLLLLDEIKSMHTELVNVKSKLESISLDGKTSEVIEGVEYLLKTKASLEQRAAAVTSLKNSEKLLQNQRFLFPQEWMPVSNVQSVFNDMCSILDRRTASMEAQLPTLELQIKEEEKAIKARTDKFIANWNANRPSDGDHSPADVLKSLSLMSAEAQKLREDTDRLHGAKAALNIDFIPDERLGPVEAEITDLRQSWQAVSPIYEKLQKIRGTPMKDLQSSQLRKELEDLTAELQNVPAKFRSYPAVEGLHEKLSKYISYQPVLRDLSTEALKDRHWKVLMEKLDIKASSPSNINVGNIWESSALSNRKVIAQILSTAQGEAALEQFLRELREKWITSEIQLVMRDTVKVVVGWEDIFTALEDNLNALASLKQSPDFKNVPEFQEDTANWEVKLTHLRGIFNIWVEVQRKWLYLRGIFKNADLKAQLPQQFTKFKGVDNEYLSLIKRVIAKPAVLELLQIDNAQRQLERQDATMAIIQKALGEYLERQRQMFPRFYFVNNDDLVEIIGNSNEPAKIIVHLAKMFAAISGVKMAARSDDEKCFNAINMYARDGEYVPFAEFVDMSVGVKDWLSGVEYQMANTLAILLQDSLKDLPSENSAVLEWIDKYPAQVVILASQVAWVQNTENAMNDNGQLSGYKKEVLEALESRLKTLSECVLQDMEIALRKKTEQLLTEMVHQRDVTRILISSETDSKDAFGWLYHLRYYWNPKDPSLMRRLCVKMSNASFFYGFEYLGIGERLVQTPLTDRCYLTLTQALHFRLGANPFGPAGTGKTESVKMLGAQMGRFVLVFNCDSAFDYAAMGRIFSGLCQVGAWGCFDEFNRLEERILSAVSQQILTIQRGLLAHEREIELMGNACKLSPDVGIFVTMNPGYAGRSNLPENLKQLFRAVAMSAPDKRIIAQVMLFSQGIVSAENLAGKIVLLFTLCNEQLSLQSHYDFGLRALKSVLVGAGELKRKAINLTDMANITSEEMEHTETTVLIKATCDNIVPKLVSEDIHLFDSLLEAVFPGIAIPTVDEAKLIEAIKQVCDEESLAYSDSWSEKVLQLKQVLDIRHGVMLVGPSGSGKTTAWRTLLKALGRVDNIKDDSYVIDPKAIDKDHLYGTLDPNTLEWTDGVFTKTLRKVSDGSGVRGVRRSWIIFDGDVDPEWAENLNSVLDDNRVLTLPSGDRIKIPHNVRIMMEVDTLKHATLATVSRTGMVWFPVDTLSLEVILAHQLQILRKDVIEPVDINSFGNGGADLQKKTQEKFVDFLVPIYTDKPGLVGVALECAQSLKHVMDPVRGRLLETLYSMLSRGVAIAIDYNDNNAEYPMSDEHLENFVKKWLLFSLLWAFGGSMTNDQRILLCEVLVDHSGIKLPNDKCTLIDLQANINDGNWVEWSTMVPRIEIEPHKVSSSDVVVTTTDTVRHIEVLKCWLSAHKPLILCGPPGSGKTMTLTSVLDSMPEFVLAALNFSAGTTPDLILKTFAQYCEQVDSPDGLVLQPNRSTYRENQWLVVFCDEINLPEQDMYGTQVVIMFLRQLTEQGGYWNTDCKWVTLKRIQFVGACNPPTDAGRVPMSERFMRHAPLLLVDYPAEDSLKQIYRCFNHAMLKLHPNLKGLVDPLNNAMVDFYLRNQRKFTPDMAPQYIYSPRELSRWIRALFEAVEPLESMTTEELVRLWGHEALRLFQDRLVTAEEKEWADRTIDEVAAKHFPGVDTTECLKRPMLYSNWIKKVYQSTGREELRAFVSARLKVFYEEELDVPLVVFDEVLDHVLRIDNVLRHPIGHVLLVGESGVGKTVLTKFVAWMNGLSIFQIKANNKYTVESFEEDLRGLFRRVGIEGEKICFIFDESNALSSAFLELMNALLASGEVPGLFEGEERAQLLASCRDSFSQKEGLIMDSEDELYRRFTKMIQRNLHVVFTMNPASSDFDSRNQTSPALYNRCVVDWFGTWSDPALIQVGYEFTRMIDTGFTNYSAPKFEPDMLVQTKEVLAVEEITLTEAIVAALVTMHLSVKAITIKLGKLSGRQHYISPRDFLDLIKKFVKTEEEMRNHLEDQQTHIRTGLNKLVETQDQVDKLRGEMEAKSEVLKVKDAEANAKLTIMVEKQNEAEQRKTLAEQLTVELEKQNAEIKIRREAVEQELSEAEPTLQAAKQSVSGIKKTQLDEVRALNRPPPAIQKTMEMVCIMIGEKNTDWTEIRKIIRRDDFISTVVNFDPMKLNSKQVKTVKDDYLNKSDIDYASVDRASKACGPLYKWAESQIKYATILRNIQPLREELAGLQAKSDELSVQQKDAIEQVGQLEAAIKQYKMEYATAIRDTETIRTEMETVSSKVSRALSLLTSLGEEKVRWSATSASFDEQMSTLIGDNLIAAAFLTYGGIFDHKIRRSLMMEWSDTLEALGIPFLTDFDTINYLSSPADHITWRDHGLPNDDLATENAILLERFNRFPLVVDPSGQATNFILNKYAAEKIVQSSFLDAAFMKTLASAIRFGTPLLVHDVEYLDPILNPVLNKEIQKTGGRSLIRIGSEEIDFSPRFMLVLVTRNPTAKFSPDLCSRVTMINFTVTPASLESQALSAILKAERPDVDRRRNEILRLQSEQSAKMRHLQEALLTKISQVQGAILDDDSVIKTLEKIKAEAQQLTEEVTSTKSVMEEVKSISNTYVPLASAMATVYFSLESLSEINFLYKYSLQFFLDILSRVLKKSASEITTEEVAAMTANQIQMNKRIKHLKDMFFAEVSRRTLRGLKYEDKLLFAVRLAQISTHGDCESELTEGETDLLLRGSAPIMNDSTMAMLQKFKESLPTEKVTESMTRQLLSLSLLPAFSGLLTSITSEKEVWLKFLEEPEAERHVPISFIRSAKGNPLTAPMNIEREALLKVLLVRALRQERVIFALEDYVNDVFKLEFDWRDHCNVNLKEIVEIDSKSSSPLMLCSAPGQDASGKVDLLSTQMGAKLLQVSMGSAEGYAEAERSISTAAKQGNWVLLRNVHLCPEWLKALEKRVHGISSHENFRLFLTCEIHPKLPAALLRMSEVLIYEASTGVKANIQRFYNSIPASRIDKAPAERGRLYGLLAWFNAVVQERLRYAPLGWTKKYEFSEADTNCSLDVIDQWVDQIAGDRRHVNPADLPWEALQTMLSQSLYGGRVDHPFDQAALDSFIKSVFTERNYAANAVLATDRDGNPLVTLPDSLNRQAFESWLKALPDSNPPVWIGLPNTAESQLKGQMAMKALANLSILQGAGDTSDQVNASTGGASAHLTAMLDLVDRWTSSLPSVNTMPAIDLARTSEAEASPLERCLAREAYKGKSVVSMVLEDLQLIREYCKGECKLTNSIRDLMTSFKKGQIPKHWSSQYNVSKDMAVGDWIVDLTTRSIALNRYAEILDRSSSIPKLDRARNCTFWLGGMFSPEAFITATRQQTAQINKWSLEDLELFLEIGQSQANSVQETIVEGLIFEGGQWTDGAIKLSDELRNILPLAKLKWEQRSARVAAPTDGEVVTFPMYLNTGRTSLVVTVRVLTPPGGIPAHIWAQRGVAIIMQAPQ